MIVSSSDFEQTVIIILLCTSFKAVVETETAEESETKLIVLPVF